MKSMNFGKMGLLMAVGWSLCNASGQSTQGTNPNATAAAPEQAVNSGVFVLPLRSRLAEVVKLSSAGLGNDVVIAYVNASPSYYSMSSKEILQLKEQGVSSDVITAMLNHDTALRGTGQTQPGNNNYIAPQNGANNNGTAVYPTQTAPQQYPVVDQYPPQSQVEYVGIAPAPDYYWYPGYWGWNDGWVWVGGYWGLRGGYGWGGYRGWGGHYGGYAVRSSAGFHGGIVRSFGAFHGGTAFRGTGGFHGGGGHR
jgi:hypothetical protein